MSEQDLAKLEVKRAFSGGSTLTAKEKGEAMCAYFKKYVEPVVKSQDCIVKQIVNLAEIFDGGLPMNISV